MQKYLFIFTLYNRLRWPFMIYNLNFRLHLPQLSSGFDNDNFCELELVYQELPRVSLPLFNNMLTSV